MSVLGIDLGVDTSVLATISKGGISVLRNEVSDRLTPSLVTYTENERLIGDMALSKLRSNYNTTCRAFKTLLGLFETPEEELKHQYAKIAKIASLGGLAGYDVGCALPVAAMESIKGGSQGDDFLVSATAVCAAFLTKLFSIAERATGASFMGCVISLPGSFNAKAKQAAYDACYIADKVCLSIISDHAATALDYGLFRSQAFEEATAPLNVVFVDIGHSKGTLTLVSYTKGKVDVQESVSSNSISGRHMDQIIIDCIQATYKTQYGCDLQCSGKAYLKMEDAAKRLKKVLTANREGSFHVECVDGENDLSGVITREQFEEMCLSQASELEALCAKLITTAKITSFKDIHAIEITGGGTRVPWVQSILEKVFAQPVSKTCSFDECVARGAAIMGGMLNPRCRVKEFVVNDRLNSSLWIDYPKEVTFKNADTMLKAVLDHPTDPSRKCAELFCGKSIINSAVTLEMQTVGSVSFKVIEVSTDNIPEEVETCHVGTCPGNLTASAKMTVTFTLESSGFLKVDGKVSDVKNVTQTYKEKIAKPAVAEPAAASKPAETPAEESSEGETKGDETASQPPKEPEVEYEEVTKTRVVKREESFVLIVTREKASKGFLTASQLDKLRKAENIWRDADLTCEKKRTLLNDCLNFCFDQKEKLRGAYKGLVTDEESLNIHRILSETEDHLESSMDLTLPELEIIAAKLHALVEHIVVPAPVEEPAPEAAVTAEE